MSQFMMPQIILLKEGTDSSQGIPQLVHNINACLSVVEAVRTTLGPRGMDKLIYDDKGETTISNDGATIMRLLDVVHPAAQTLVDISMSQDTEVGDGTTSVVVLAGEFLKEARPFVEDGVHPQVIVKGYRNACAFALNKIRELAITVDMTDPVKKREMLLKCAMTSLNSKLIASKGEFFGKMVVDAVLHLDEDLDMNMVGIKKVAGGSTEDSFLVEGVAFEKTFSYAGFEQQPKRFENPKVLVLNMELELKSEKDNAEIRINDISEYQRIIDAEWSIIYNKLENIAKSNAQVVLSRLAIGDLATQYFADRGIFCSGRVTDDDIRRVCKATSAQVQTTVNNLIPEVLGKCSLFEEIQVGDKRYNLFTGCPDAKTSTIVIRGGADQFIEEADRSLHDAIMIVRRAIKNNHVVAGGGAIEMELSWLLRNHARTIHGKQQFLVAAFAKALEIIPRQLSDNAGFDSTDVLNQLRQKHANGGKNFGVDIINGGICDTFEKFVWEPSLVRLNALTAATEAACMILSVDETIKNPQSEQQGHEKEMAAMGAGRGRGRGGR